jgi:hypothetical protein
MEWTERYSLEGAKLAAQDAIEKWVGENVSGDGSRTRVFNEHRSLRALLLQIAAMWPGHAECDFERTSSMSIALLIRDAVTWDRAKIAKLESEAAK